MKNFRKDETFQRYHGSLPHWSQDGVTYFITFRMADSIPESAMAEWKDERGSWIRRHGFDPDGFSTACLSLEQKKEFEKKFGRRFQELMDAGHGSCLLQDSANAKIVAEAFHFFHESRYLLGSYVVMPNHAHLLLTPQANYRLAEIMQSLKRFTSQKINRREGHTGTFWQAESYDHIVRSERQLGHYQKYIRENPEKAHLKEGRYFLEMRE